MVVTRVSVVSCLECHQDSTGQGAVPGCAACHLGGAQAAPDAQIMHPDGDPVSPNFDLDAFTVHRSYAADTLGGNATSCSLSFCHGADLTGGTAPPNGSWRAGYSCYTCHGKLWTTP